MIFKNGIWLFALVVPFLLFLFSALIFVKKSFSYDLTAGSKKKGMSISAF